MNTLRGWCLIDTSLWGTSWADPTAPMKDVRRTMRVDLHIGVEIEMEPQDARVWADVERVRIGKPFPIDVFMYADLRTTRWELYAEPRGVPVMHKGEIEKYIVVPWYLSVGMAQRRVDLWAERIFTYQIIVLDEENWVILKRLQPDSVRAALTAYEEVVMHHINRGGMRREATLTNDHHAVGAWDRNMYLILWLDIAHAHTYAFAPYVVHRRVSIWRLRRYLAELFDMHENEIIITNHNAAIPLETFMEQLVGVPLVVHLRRYEDMIHYHDRYPAMMEQDGILDTMDTLDTRSQPPSPSNIEPNMIEEAHVIHQQHGEDHGHIPRGAGRRNRLNRADPRTLMLGWAKDKVLEKVPELNPATVHFLLRAENRTVGAILNARSPTQVKEVIYAAWKRAGLDDQGRPTQQSTVESVNPVVGGASAYNHPAANQLMQVVQNQSQEIQQLLAVMQSQPTQQDYITLVTSLQQQGDAQTEAMRALTTLIAKMEMRVEHWENAFLHKLLENSPQVAPPTPLYPEEESDQQRTAEAEGHQQEQQGGVTQTELDQGQHTSASSSSAQPMQPSDGSGAMHEPPREVTSLEIPMLTSLQERSLNTQCAKVVRRAMKPFPRP